MYGTKLLIYSQKFNGATIEKAFLCFVTWEHGLSENYHQSRALGRSNSEQLQVTFYHMLQRMWPILDIY